MARRISFDFPSRVWSLRSVWGPRVCICLTIWWKSSPQVYRYSFTPDSSISCLAFLIFISCLPACSSQLLWRSCHSQEMMSRLATPALSPLDAAFQLLGNLAVALSRGLVKCNAIPSSASACVSQFVAEDLLCESRPKHTYSADVSGGETDEERMAKTDDGKWR